MSESSVSPSSVGFLRVFLMARHNQKPLPAEFRLPWRIHGGSEGDPLQLNDGFAALELIERLPAGASAIARVRPLVPESWAHLRPRDQLRLYIGADEVGTALLLERVSDAAARGLMSSRQVPVSPLELATVRALIRFRLADARKLPDLAARYVAFGIDSDALIDLAGLDLGHRADPFDARDGFTEFLVEVGLLNSHDHDSQVSIAAAHLARRGALRLDQPRQVCRRFYGLAVAVDYEWPHEEIGELYGLDDEWQGRWGRTAEQLEMVSDAACTSLLAKVEPEWGVLDNSAIERIETLFQ